MNQKFTKSVSVKSYLKKGTKAIIKESGRYAKDTLVYRILMGTF